MTTRATSAPTRVITVIGKPDCHLCDVADRIVETVVAGLPDEVDVEIRHSSIADDPVLYASWWDKIPVVLVDGELHAHWRVSADRLRQAILKEEG